MEVNHHVLGPDDCAESGVAVLEAFLDEGNGRSPWEPDAGYPNRLLFGDFATSIRATGADRAARRKSRTEIWRNRGSFKALQREFLASQAIRVKAEYSGEPLPCGFALVCRTRVPPRSETVRVNGKSVEAATYRDRCSTYVSVEIYPSGKEEDEVLIEL